MNSKIIKVLLVIYTLAFFLLLLQGGIFWDDWTLYNSSTDIIIKTYINLGYPYLGYFYVALFSIPYAIVVHKVFVFVAFLISSLLFEKILKSYLWINEEERTMIILFSAVFPLFSSRITLICTVYVLHFLTFFIGFYFVNKFLQQKKKTYRILSLLSFIFTFFTNSFIFYYLAVIFHLWRNNSVKKYTVKSLIETIFCYPDYVLLPGFFWISKNIFFKPSMTFAGYNKISYAGILSIPVNLIRVFYDTFINLFFLPVKPIIIIPLTLLVYLLLKPLYKDIGSKNKRILMILLMGIVLFLLGVIPYLVVQKVPMYSDWANRFQLLIIPASGFIMFSFVSIFNKLIFNGNKSAGLFLISIFLAFCVQYNITEYFNYQKDSLKQAALIENFRTNELIRNNQTFIFIDNLRAINVNRRTYRFYEYTGMFKYVYSDQARFGTDIERLSNDSDIMSGERYKNNIDRMYYNIGDYHGTQPQFNITINPGKYSLSDKRTIQLTYFRIFNNNQFQRSVKDLVSLDVQKR